MWGSIQHFLEFLAARPVLLGAVLFGIYYGRKRYLAWQERLVEQPQPAEASAVVVPFDAAAGRRHTEPLTPVAAGPRSSETGTPESIPLSPAA